MDAETKRLKSENIQLKKALATLLNAIEPSRKWDTQAELRAYIHDKHGNYVLECYDEAAGLLASLNNGFNYIDKNLA